MSEPRLPAGIETLIRAVAGGADDADRDRRASTFARGLAIGALVGAAIAGSTIWQRRQDQLARIEAREYPSDPAPDAPGDDPPGAGAP